MSGSTSPIVRNQFLAPILGDEAVKESIGPLLEALDDARIIVRVVNAEISTPMPKSEALGLKIILAMAMRDLAESAIAVTTACIAALEIIEQEWESAISAGTQSDGLLHSLGFVQMGIQSWYLFRQNFLYHRRWATSRLFLAERAEEQGSNLDTLVNLDLTWDINGLVGYEQAFE